MTDRENSGAHTYRDAGVDNTSGARAKERIGEAVQSTYTDDVVGGFGHFGGMFRAPGSSGQILVSSADSVGTKVLLAVHAGRHKSIGIDLVNHSINDILCCGARPLYFLDYFATSSLEESILADLVEGMTSACREAGCALIGGETAQLPGIYQQGTYDLAGFIVGAVDESEIIDGSAIRPGDSIIGFTSNGLHTNGYSLARAVLGLTGDTESIQQRLGVHQPELGETLGDALLRPHKSYLPTVNTLLEQTRPTGLAHITGGGISGNLERIIPRNCTAYVDASRWETPALFDLIQREGTVDLREMFSVFNMGVGLIGVFAAEFTEQVLRQHEDARLIGDVRAANDDDTRVVIEGLDSR